MNLIQRYLFKHLFGGTLLVVLALTGAIWMIEILRLMDLVIEGGAPFVMFLRLAVMSLPTFIGLILPIGLVVGLLFSYNRLTQESELIVMRAIGTAPFGLSSPAIVLAFLVMGFCYFLSLYVTPVAHHNLLKLEREVRTQYSDILLRTGLFNEVTDNITVYVGERTKPGQFRSIMVYDNTDPENPTVLQARFGSLIHTGDGARFHLYEGNRQEGKTNDRGAVAQLYFERYAVDLTDLKKEIGIHRMKPREMPLMHLIKIDPKEKDPNYITRLKGELHMRLTLPFLAISFVMIALGTLLPGEFNRRGQMGRILKAGLYVFLLQAATLVLINIASRMPPMIPVLYLVTIAPAFWGLWRVTGSQNFDYKGKSFPRLGEPLNTGEQS